MAYLVWGKAKQLSFADQHEYYQALGSLCRRGSYTITFETNSQTESWGDAFINAMRNARRINCNDYVQNLYEQHDFDFDVANKVLHGDYNKVKRTVPTSYYEDFENGYNLCFTRYGKINNKKATVAKTEAATSRTKSQSSFLRSMNNVTQSHTVTYVSENVKKTTVAVKKGDVVIHKSFGEGIVKNVAGEYIKVEFKKLGEKSFANPGAFDMGFLSKA